MTADLSRRVTLGWMAAASATAFAATGCETLESARRVSPPPDGPQPVSLWKDVAPAPIEAPGYGRDPSLTAPVVPWSLTLNQHQRATLRAAADLMLPTDATSPSGGAVHLDAFIDEWISAPYPQQERDRGLILSGLAWFDAETMRRYGVDFAQASNTQQRVVFDTMAFRDKVQPGYEWPAQFFVRLRGLMLAGYYSLPEGVADLGYIGNTPIAGPYPGPTEEAMANLNASLAKLGLKPVSPG